MKMNLPVAAALVLAGLAPSLPAPATAGPALQHARVTFVVAAHGDEPRVRLEKLVHKLWPDASTVSVEQDRAGVSPFTSTRVWVNQQVYHVKMALALANLDVAEFATEIALARWAGERGLGPAVVLGYAEDGVLVTAFVQDAVADWDAGAQEPKLSAMVQFMAEMNRGEQAQQQTIDANRLMADLAGSLRHAQDHAGRDHDGELAQKLARLDVALPAIAQRLHQRAFFPARTHGDFHQNNFLYQPGRSVMVDWGRSKLGDPMAELAYLAYFTDRGMAQLPQLVQLYGPGANTSLERAEVYLALHHAHLFAEEALGLEPQRAMSREEKLGYLWNLLQQDLAHFGQ